MNKHMSKIMKKSLAVILASFLAFSCVGCGDDWDDDYDDDYGYEDEYDDYDEYGDEDYDDDYYDDYEEESGGSSITSSASAIKGTQMSVAGSTGELSIERTVVSNTGDIGDEGVWTIFVYLCGTDLESDGGMGTDDLDEMMGASPSDNVRFVVETGGTDGWNTDEVDDSKLQRFVVQNGDIEMVDEQSLANMGVTSTLSDFLVWGTSEYASEHMGLVMWNHGGGSITGVCFDEMYDSDSIDLMEMDSALSECAKSSNRRFDFIGFDACLMGTVEVANVLATYADYMYGSEETEPGSGWDYKAIGSYLAKNPEAGGADLGKEVCDSFLAACEAQNDDDLTTLAVIDLSKMDNLLTSFNGFAKNMYEAGQDSANIAEMVRGIKSADNYGGNNKTEGYTNMVDMGGIIEACSTYADGAEAAQKALSDTVVYQVTGSAHPDASGLSMYYPLSIQGSNELSIFEKISVSPYYLSFVDRQNKTGATDEDFDDYDDEQFFEDDGDWEYGTSDDSYWDYLDDYEQTGESSYITFTNEPEVEDDGTFGFKLDQNGINNASGVIALVYTYADDGNDILELGETTDVVGDWNTGEFSDNFDGYWLSLPDGQNIATYVVEETEDYVVYTSPILLNDEETNLRLKQYFSDGSVEVEGAWDGIDEDGVASREIIKLKKGDVITPCYYAFDADTYEESEYAGAEYTVTGTLKIEYDIMDVGDYLYSFCIDDIYGDYYMTDYVVFSIDEDGNITFE